MDLNSDHQAPKVRLVARSLFQGMSLWKWELLAMLLGTISFAGTLILLIEIDGKPLKSWRIANAEITPNALLSVLSTITKTAILLPIAEGISQLKWTYFQQRPHRLLDLQVFDKASRGPWAAIMLMSKVHMGAVVATIGAALTLFTLAMDPFSQQVLSYPLRTIAADNMTATISQPHILWNEWGSSGVRGWDAMAQGVFSRDLQPSYNCPTGNCTWPTFETLGICNQCSAMDVIGPTTPCHEVQTPNENGVSAIPQLACNYTLSDDTIVTMFYFLEPESPPKYVSFYPLYTSLLTWPDPGDISVGFPSLGDDGAIVRITAMQPIPFSEEFVLHGNSTPPTPIAHQCTLSFCTKEFDSEIRPGGSLLETLRSSAALQFESCYKKWYHNLAYPDGWAFLEPCVGVKSNKTSLADDLRIGDAQRESASYKLSYQSLVGLMYNIGQVFPDELGMNGRASQDFGVVPSDLVGYALLNLFNDDVQQMLDNIAESLTNWIRASPNGTHAIGNAWEQKTFVHVSWAWLTLPAAIVALTTVFLVASIIFSLEKDQLVWKSSALALLFHRLQGWRQDELNKKDQRDMVKAAEHFRVHLIDDSDGHVSFVKA